MIMAGMPYPSLSNIASHISAGRSLVDCLFSYVHKKKNLCRTGRLAFITGKKGNEIIIADLEQTQLSDGGWSDVEETIWCISALEKYESENLCTKRAKEWLIKQQHIDGGWGLSERDASRIPTTGLLLYLLPELANDKALNWISNEWRKDLAADVKLTYKGGFTLMALAKHRGRFQDNELVNNTFDYLKNEQNDDGGFGPWKNHPIGSDPWSTGITLVGLTSWPEYADKEVIERAVQWLCDTQLESGLWAYHFIDEGSAYAYWGLKEAAKYLENHS